MPKRCFTDKITESDAFLEMPQSTQNLYFHLNMNTDDDGFVNAPKRITRLIGANEDDLKLLIAKSFVLCFDSGVIVIKHFRMHNTLRNDRYHPTSYQEEYKMLGLKENGAYTWQPNGNQMATKWQPNGNQLETEHNITKHNITKHNKTKHKYGEYLHVSLAQNEYSKLEEEFGLEQTKEFIRILDEYMELNGKSYKNCYLAIRKWVINAYQERQHIDTKLGKYDDSANNDIDTSKLEEWRKQ